MFEGLWEFRAVHPPLLPPPRNAWGAWKGVLRAGGILRGPERGVRAGPVGVSQGSSTPIVRPGCGGLAEPSTRRWSCGLRAPAPASAWPGSARREAGREPSSRAPELAGRDMGRGGSPKPRRFRSPEVLKGQGVGPGPGGDIGLTWTELGLGRESRLGTGMEHPGGGLPARFLTPPSSPKAPQEVSAAPPSSHPGFGFHSD